MQRIRMEPIVRPWLNARQPVNPRVQINPASDEELSETTIVWGAKMPSQFDSAPGVSIRVVEDQTEVNRVTHDKRVENPDDPSQFVDVKVIDEINFRGADGKIRKYKLVNPE